MYLIARKLACDHRFHDVSYTTIIRQRTKDFEEMEKIEKYRQNNVRIVYNSWCVCMCVCVWGGVRKCVCVCVCLYVWVAYICVLLCVDV